MNTILYSPYEELTIHLDEYTHKMQLKLPWLAIEAEYEPQDKNDIIEIKNSTATPNKISDFLSIFSDQIIAYSIPRTNLKLMPEQCSKTKHLITMNDSPTKVLQILLPAHVLVDLDETKWKWSMDEILTKSQIQEQKIYDPLSAYRVFLRFLMLHGNEQPNDGSRLLQLMSYFKDCDEPLFFEYAKYYLRQYHHVTTTSYEALLPATYSFDVARKELERFAEEERGHGNFTQASLKGLEVQDINSIPLNTYTPALIDLLRFTASTNLTAFAMLTTCFELGGEQNEDPLAKLLLDSSKPGAAKGIQAHFDLNKSGVHFLSGEPYVKLMGAVDKESIIEAVRIVELFLILQAQLDKDILNYGLKLWEKKYHRVFDIEKLNRYV